ncbi:MAG: M23 family metallopeptidase [Sinobacteraceae bacterium]|nr:M23 family metallopeptidase [Nevskiaceae bacterium]MCP5360305.1 M23 family metallopeptidase [Nevskiaceae bacterium]MCP5471194.1 M23 family metallopeptidase [Nevskiaceae bacterium]
MPPEIRSRLPFPSLSKARWLQIGACALLAAGWLLSRGSAPQDTPAADALQAGTDAAAVAAHAAMGATSPADGAAAGSGARAPINEAGLGFSTFEVIVSRNDTLDRIFRNLSLSLADLASLRALPELRKQLDRLHVGEALKLSVRGTELVALERRLSPSETLKVVRAEGGFSSDVIDNPLEKDIRTTTGTITSSLFQAASAAGIADKTALQIADIFAWDIDFVLDIQRNDSFSVTYEHLSQDGRPIGDGDILAVEFVNAGKTYRAVRFTSPDGTSAFYTPDGQSLRKAFIRAPVQFSRISSRFNLQRRHPVLNRIRAHKGVDYAAPTGTPVHASGDGKVAFVGVKGGYGKVVEIAHAGGVTTRYGHLSRFPKGLSQGMRVRQSQVIGYVGMTGLATGPHLHYEYMVRGVHKDPQKVILPKAEPVPAALMADFRRATAPLLATLDPVAAGPAGSTLAASGGPALPQDSPGVIQTGVAAGR